MPKKLIDMSVKDLETQVRLYEAELARINTERRSVAQLLSDAQQAIITKRKPQVAPTCSDHAIIRYLERAKGLDVDAIRSKILSASAVSAINAGAVSITIDGFKFCIRDKVVTTVLDS